ncbi:MAG: hypothetical protein KF906_03325 [Actinobacteria bacterium]|nr:hypothetical protein [Actinomycetota bacterium]
MLGLLGPLVLVAAACEPVPHPNHVVVDPASTIEAVLLSGDGHFVVARATAASATVPGPGLWLIDRRDGTTSELPLAPDSLLGISDDGQRILVQDPGTTRVWTDGAYVTAAPAGSVFSRDLRFAIFTGLLTSRLTRVDLATGTRTVFGTAGLNATGIGISDDGAIAWYQTTDPVDGCSTTIFEIATAATTVFPTCDAIVSASGNFVAEAPLLDVYGFEGTHFGGSMRIRLFYRWDPDTVIAEMSTIDEALFTDIKVAADRPVVWATEVLATGSVSTPCGTLFTPPCDFTQTTTAIVVASPKGTHRMSAPADLGSVFIDYRPKPTTITADGRFLAFSSGDGELHVLDRLGSRQEVLVGDGALGKPRISNDGRVVVVGENPVPTYPGTGWQEFLADGEAATPVAP